MSPLASPEVPLWIQVNDRRRTCWTCTPVDVEALALGYLLTAGYIGSDTDLQALQLVSDPNGWVGVRVRVPVAAVERVLRRQRHMRREGCGLLHHVVCEPQSLHRVRSGEAPAGEDLRPAFRALFAATDAAFPDGGMHAAAVWWHTTLVATAFDVGRHNAVDRALGLALRHTLDLTQCGLLLSSRVSGAIALKAATAGVAFVASRSIPTTLAVQIADAAGLPLLARAGRSSGRQDSV